MLDSDKVITPNFAGPTISVNDPKVKISRIWVNEDAPPSPANFNQHTSISFTASSTVKDYELKSASFSIFFQFLPENPVFYKVVGSQWKQIYPLNECQGVSDIIFTGTTLSYNMAVNSECNSEEGISYKKIVDPLIVGSFTGGGSSSGRCFIATAAYGSYLHPFVKILRDFRDRVLLTASPGRSFVAWYYRVSPPIADVIARYDWLSAAVRIALLPAVGLTWLCLKVGVVPVGLMLLVFFAAIITVSRTIWRKRCSPAS